MYGSGLKKKNVILTPLVGDSSFVEWFTPFGSLGTINVASPVDLSVSAQSSDASGITYAISEGSLAPLSLDVDSGQIAGTAPPTVQTLAFVVRASNGSGQFSDQMFSLAIVDKAPIWLTPAGLIGSGTGGDSFAASLLAVDPNNLAVSYALRSGPLPSGLTLNATTGVLSGVLPVLGARTPFDVTITASNGAYSADRAFSISVDFVAAMTWVSAPGSLGSDVQGHFFYAAVSAVSYVDNAVVSYRVSAGDLPSGLALDPTSGVISGALPNVSADTLSAFSLTAEDGINTVPRQFSITTLAAATSTDPFANSVVLLMPMDVADNANSAVQQVFIDRQGHSVTASNPADPSHPDPVNARATHLFGNAAASFAGTATLRIVGGSEFDLSQTDFTIEFYALPLSGTPVAFFGVGAQAAKVNLALAHDGAESLVLSYRTAADQPATASFPWTLPYGVWSHIALVRSATTVRAFADGTLLGTASISSGLLAMAPYQVLLGSNDYGASDPVFYHGLLDAVRITRAARYSANFPLPIRPWPNLPVWSLPAVLPDAIENTLYSASLDATQADGHGLLYSATGLPAGLGINPSIAVISGLAPAVASNTVFHPVFTVSDGYNAVALTTTLIERHHLPPAWLTTGGSLGVFVEGTPVQIALSASNPQFLPLTYLVLSGQLPPGLAINGAAISGTAPAESANARFDFTLGVSDGQATVARDFTLLIEHNLPPVWVSNGTVLSGVQNQTVSTVLVATDPLGQAIRYALTAGTLPSGLVLDAASGTLSGTLPRVSTDTTVNLSVQARNTGGLASTQDVAIVIQSGVLPSWITAAGDLGSVLALNDAVRIVLAGNANIANVVPSFSVTTGTLPAGLTLTNVGGTATITGIAAAVSTTTTSHFAITLDNASRTATQAFSLTVTVNHAIVWSSASNLGSYSAGTAITRSLSASSLDLGALTYRLSSGTLPAGLSLDSLGALSGPLSPVAAASSPKTFTFNVIADNGLTTASRSFTLALSSALPVWTSTNSLLGTLYTTVPTSHTFTATSTAPLSYTVSAGSVPSGLVLNATTGVLSGTPDTPGNAAFTLAASDGVNTATAAFSAVVAVPGTPAWTTQTTGVTQALASTPYGFQLVATDPNNASLSYSLSGGTLPAGISLSSSGRLSGTPAAVAASRTTTVTISADNGMQSAPRDFNLTVLLNEALAWGTATGTIINAPATSAVNFPLQISNASLYPAAFAIAGGSFPNSLSLDSETGLISGNLPVVGTSLKTYTFTVQVTNTVFTISRSFNIVAQPVTPVWLTRSGNLGSDYSARVFTATLAASSPLGLSDIHFTLLTGALPNGLNLRNNADNTATITGYLPDVAFNQTTSFVIAAQNTTVSISQTFSITTLYNPFQWLIPSGSLGTVFAGNAYTQTGVRVGSDATYQLTAGSLPSGINLASNGNLTGLTPQVSASTTSSFEITATATSGSSAPISRLFSITILPSAWLAVADPYSDFVVLQMPMNIVSGSNPYPDVMGHTVNGGPYPAPAYTTTRAVWNGSSLRFNGGNYLVINDAPAFDFSTSDFTVEFWSAFTAQPSVGRTSTFFASPYFNLSYRDGAVLVSLKPAASGNPTVLSFACPLDTSWHNLALVNANGTISLLVDGTQIASPIAIGALTPVSIYPQVWISVLHYNGFQATQGFAGTMADLRVSRAARYSASYTLSRVPDPTLPVITAPASLPAVYGGLAATARQLSATDPYNRGISVSIVNGALPGGMSLSSEGLLSGTPDNPSEDTTYHFAVAVSDGLNTTHSNYDLLVYYYAPAVWSTAAGSLGSVLSGYAFSAIVAASSSQHRTITYGLVSGSLPANLTLNTTTGRISGTAALLGSNATTNFTLGASDTLSVASQAFSITAQANNPPVWQTSAGLLGRVSGGSGFTATVSAIDPQGQSVSYSIASGQLPGGLSLNATTGVISGTAGNPNADSTSSFILRASNSFTSSTLALSILVQTIAAPVFQTVSNYVLLTPANTVFSFAVLATDPQGLPLSFSASGYPANVTLSADGVLSGTPGNPAHYDGFLISPQQLTYSVVVSATNGVASASCPIRLRVFVPQPPVFAVPLAGPLGSYVSGSVLAGQAITVSDPFGLPLSFSIGSGALPAGLGLNTANATISGTFGFVSSNATYNFAIAASNGYVSASRAYSYLELPFAKPTWITAAGSLGNAVETTAFSTTLQATSYSGQAPGFSLSTGTLPAGLSLDASTGVISGRVVNPASKTTTGFSISLSDGFNSVARSFSITANPIAAPTWTASQHGRYEIIITATGGLLYAPINNLYDGGATLPDNLTIGYATDPQGLPITFSTTSSLPNGVSLTADGHLIGTIANDPSLGAFTIVLSAANAYASTTRNWTLYTRYIQAPQWTTAAGLLLTAKGGLAQSLHLAASDPLNLTLTYALTSGSLPDGLMLSSAGVISGTAANPDSDATYDFTITVSNASQSTPRDFSIVVQANTPPVWQTSAGLLATLPSKVLIDPIDLSVSSALGDALTFGFISSGLPSGLTLNTSTGRISGTPAVVQTDTTTTFTIKAIETDGANAPVSRTFSIIVLAYAQPVFSTAAGSLGSVLGGYTFNYGLSAVDPHGLTLTYSKTAGTLPPGLSVSTNGTISGTATNPASSDSTYTFTIAASDGQAAPTAAVFSITVLYNTPPVFSTAAGSLGSFTGFDAVDVAVSATDPNDQAVTYSKSAGTLPPGLAINAASGAITGTLSNPAANTTYSFTVKATNLAAFSTQVNTITVTKYLAPVWSGASALGTYVNGAIIDISPLASDPQGGSVSFAFASGSFPSGLSLDVTTAEITGTLGTVGVQTTNSFAITAFNAHLQTSQNFTLVVKPYTVANWGTPAGSLGTLYGGDSFNQTLTASDPNGLGFSLSFSMVSGALPAGLSLASNGQISGTAQNTSTTTSSFVIAVSNGFVMSNRSFSITVNATAAPVWSTPASLGALLGTTTVSLPLLATDPRGLTVNYLADPANASNGYTLPAGLLFNAANATIYGTLTSPASTVNFSFGVISTNGIASTARTFTGSVLHLDAPLWQTANGSLGSVIGLSTCAAVPLEMNFEATIADNAGHSVTVQGGAALSNTTAAVGSSSLATGSGQYLMITPDSDEFALRQHDFTIEFSVNFASFNGAGSVYKSTIIEQWNIGNNLSWGVSYYAPGATFQGLQFYYSTNGQTANYQGAAWTPSLGTWYRIAICKSGTTLRLFVNGTLLGSAITGFNPAIYVSTVPLIIGFCATLNGGYLVGGLDEVRLSTGIGRYTANYTPLALPFHSAPGIAGLRATDSNNLPISYALSGTLPAGIIFDANTALFSGSFGNVGTVTTYPFTVSASNGYLSTPQDFSITLIPETAPTWVTATGTIGNVLGGYSFSTTLAATDANYPAVLYTMANGTSLPSGFALNSVSGVIAGVSTNPAGADQTTGFTVSASDGFLSNTLNVAVSVRYNTPPVIGLTQGQVLGPWFGNVAMTTTISAIDANNQPISFTASLPAGLTISNSGVISGAIAQPATAFANVAATITASNGFSANTVSFFIGEQQTPPANWISPPAGSLGNVIQNYAITPTTLVAVDPGGANVAYSITVGSLPPGLLLNAASGVISGTPSEGAAGGTYSFSVAASNGIVANTRAFSYRATVNLPPVFGTATLPTGFSTENYVGSLSASDPSGLGQAISFSLASGSLPANLVLNSNGVVSGVIATVSNTSVTAFTAQAVSLGGNTVSGNLSIQTTPYVGPSWSTASGSLGTVLGGQSFSSTVGALDHEGLGLTYALANGTSLPAGLTLSNATISGIATNPAGANTTSTFQITASDAYGSNTQTFSIQVVYSGPPVFTSSGSLLQMYGTTASGPVYGEFASSSSISMNLPVGLNSSTGYCLEFSIQFTDLATLTAGAAVLNGGAAGLGLVFYPNKIQVAAISFYSTDAAVSLTIGVWYHIAYIGSGGVTYLFVNGVKVYTGDSGGYNNSGTWVGSGNTFFGGSLGHIPSLVRGWRISTGTGVYATTGFTPPAPTSTLTSSASTQLLVINTLTSFADESSHGLSITQTNAPVIGHSATVTVSATDPNNQSLSYAVANATTLPATWWLNPSSGVLTGISNNPTSNTVTNFILSASNGQTIGYGAFSIEIDQTLPPVFVTNAGSLGSYAANTVISTAVVATDPQGLAVTYTTVAGTWPTGLTLAANGVVSGTTPKLAATATANVTVQASTASTGLNATRGFAVTVTAVPVPTWTTIAGSLGTVLGGSTFANTVSATDPGYTVTYSVTAGTLPAGLNLNASTGTITGTATNPGTTQNAVAFTITASDGTTSAAQAFSIQVVYDAPPIINTAGGSLATVYGGAAVSASIVAYDPTGYNQTLTYSLSAGTLPAGLTLNSASGLISGTTVNPGSSSTVNFTVQVSNGLTSATQSYSITVNAVIAPTWLTTANLGDVYQTQSINQSVIAIDNNGLSLSYALTSGTLPSGLAMSSAGVITGSIVSNAATGLDSFTITAADTLTNAAQTFTMNVVAYAPPIWTTASGVLVSGTSNAVVNTVVVATSIEGYAIVYALDIGSTLPDTLSLSAGGALTGTLPIIGGTYSFAILASDGVSSISQNFAVAVSATAPVWVTSSLPAVSGLLAYSTTLVATNAASYTITSGTLPSGLSLNAATGVISGTPANVSGVQQTSVTIGAFGSGSTVNQTFTFVVTQNTANYDPYSGAVILSLPLTGINGANSATVFADAIGHTVNVVGAPVVQTMVTYNGQNQTPAVYFPALSYLSIPLGVEAVFASNDYTIEWSAIGTLNNTILTFGTTAAGATPLLQVTSTGILIAPFGSTTTANVLPYTAQTLTNAWFNHALVKHGSTLSLYVNGVLATSATAATIASLGTPSYAVLGGMSVAVSFKNLRVTNGAARYNGNYTVPATLPGLPRFGAAANSLLGVLTAGIAMTPLTVSATDPWGLGLTFTADGLPAGVSMSASGVISGTPTGVYLDTQQLAVSVSVQDAYFNTQTRNFLVSVLAQPVADLQGGNTVLMMHFDGQPGSNTFTEALGHNVAISAGTPVISTANSLFGGSSGFFNGASRLAVPQNNNEFNFGNNDFTIEVSVLFTTAGSSTLLALHGATGSGFGWFVGTPSSSNIIFNYSAIGSDNNTLSFAYTMVANTWYRIAACRKNGILTLYVNGQIAGSPVALPPIYPTNNPLSIGGESAAGGGYMLSGYIDEIRITNGYARYSAPYTLATVEYANPIYWPQSSVLGGRNGTAVSYNLTPVEPYGASFTALSASGLPAGLSFNNGIVSGTLATVATDTTSTITVSATSAFSAASHNFQLTNYTTPAAADAYASNVTCFMSFNGLNASNTTTLLYNPAFVDQTGLSIVQIVGNPSISTTVTKNSGGSLALNGASALILTPVTGTPFSFGGGNFTIECCVYLTSTASNPVFVASWATGSTESWIASCTSSTLAFSYSLTGSTSTPLSVSWTPTLNTWYQLAFARSGNNLYFFVNGSQVGTAQAISGSLFAGTTAQIGYNQVSGAAYLSGYIDAVRVTSGIARYTAGYTPAEYPPPVVWTTPSGSLTTIIGGNSL